METATNMPHLGGVGGGRRRREMEDMDLYVDTFDKKIAKKMPFLNFYWTDAASSIVKNVTDTQGTKDFE